MSQGFFPESLLVSKAPPSLLPKCGACGLFKLCQSPKMPVNGEGRRKILIVGEAPGKDEDQENRPFVGKAGQLLEDALSEIGIDLRRDCWITNALICRPPGNKIRNKRAIDYCRPNLMKLVNQLQPHTIILLGTHAVQSLLGEIWRENPGGITRWAGWDIPCQKLNAWVCPTWHPSYLLREKSTVLEMHFRRHLKRAFRHTARPWTTVPDWEKDVEVIMDTDRAAKMIRRVARLGGDVAFDYEGNCLKPEEKGGLLLCASVCWRTKKTFAYPWAGAAIKATGEMLKSKKCRFTASNLKHEDRHTRHVFGHGVRHWEWDTMLAAHFLDNRKGICSLKFQAFVHLGVPSYDDQIKRFLRATKEQRLNRAASEVDLRQLLHYCGSDSLLELKLKRWQKKRVLALRIPTIEIR